MKSIFIILLLCVFSQSSVASFKLQPINKTDSIVEGKIYLVKAVVKKKLREQNRMIIKHERVKGLMEAMTMAFPVSDSTIFDNCAVGSKGTFTLEIKDGFPIITAAKFTKLPKYVCPMHPEELSNTPGSCTICGMPLEKRKL